MFRGKWLHIPESKHNCKLPGSWFWPPKGSIWQCKCGKKYKCLGLSLWADIIEWKLLDDEETQLQTTKDE